MKYGDTVRTSQGVGYLVGVNIAMDQALVCIAKGDYHGDTVMTGPALHVWVDVDKISVTEEEPKVNVKKTRRQI